MKRILNQFGLSRQYQNGLFVNNFLPDRLKALRGQQTQAEFAKALGLSQVAYGRYELGKREPSLDVLIQIGLKMGVSTNWLLGLEDGEKKGADALTSTPATCSDCVAKDLEIARLRGALEQSRHHEAALLSALGSKKEVPPAVPASGAVAGRARTGA